MTTKDGTLRRWVDAIFNGLPAERPRFNPLGGKAANASQSSTNETVGAKCRLDFQEHYGSCHRRPGAQGTCPEFAWCHLSQAGKRSHHDRQTLRREHAYLRQAFLEPQILSSLTADLWRYWPGQASLARGRVLEQVALLSSIHPSLIFSGHTLHLSFIALCDS